MKTQKQKSTKYPVDIKVVLFLLILTSIVLSVSYLAKPTVLLGSEPYLHARFAEDPFKNYDELSYSGRHHFFSAWSFTIQITSKIFNTSILLISKTLPIILGLFSILIFYFILRKIVKNNLIAVIAPTMLAISPPFIYLFTISNTHTMPVFISLLSFLLMLYNKKILSTILILTLPFFGAIHSLIAGILLLVYVLKEKKIFYLPLSLLLLLSSIYPVLLYGFPQKLIFNDQGIITQFISDFGGKFGISIFAFILSLFGILKLWEKKYKNLLIYSGILFFIILSLLYIKTLFYFNLLIVYLATLGFFKLMETKWESETIQGFTLLILCLGLIFSTISFTTNLTKLQPNEEIINGLKHLNSITTKDDIILSHRSRGHWITAIAKRKNVMDENYFYAPEVNQRYKDLQKLYTLRDEKQALEILKKYSITHIWFDKSAKDMIWQKPNQGFSFLLEYSDKIKKIYKQDNIEIWEIREIPRN